MIPVRKHIPSFDNYRAGFIQIRHLLNHTSGFRIGTLFLQPYMQPSAEHPDAPNLKLEAARFGEVGAEVLPGTSYSYSNPGYNTLGALVEIASGQSLESFLDDRIYTPLGMDDSYNHELPEKLDGKLDRMGAVYYERRNGEWVPGWEAGDRPQVPFVRASGGMISTAADYAIFCQMFLNGGVYDGARILAEATVERMTSDTYFSGGEFDPDAGCPRGVRIRVGSRRGRDLLPHRLRRDRGLGRSQSRPHRPGLHPDPEGGQSQGEVPGGGEVGHHGLRKLSASGAHRRERGEVRRAEPPRVHSPFLHGPLPFL